MTKDMTQLQKQGNPKIAQAVIQLSRLKYGKPRELVEAEVAQRSKL